MKPFVKTSMGGGGEGRPRDGHRGGDYIKPIIILILWYKYKYGRDILTFRIKSLWNVQQSTFMYCYWNVTGKERQFYLGKHQKSKKLFLNLLHIDIFEQILKYLNSMDLINLYQADKNHRDLIGRNLRKYKFVCQICDRSTYGIPYVDSCHIITLKW